MLSRASAADDPPIASEIAAVPTMILHVRVIWSSTAFGSDPVDVLGRVLDVAGLAVDAILGVDLQPRFTACALDEFIDACRAIALLGAGIDRQVYCRWYVRILERQMNRLILLMISVGDEYRGQPIEGQHAVGLGIIDRRGRLFALQPCVVGFVL